MRTAVRNKSPKVRACWHAYRLADVIAWWPLYDAGKTTTGSTNYQTIYCNSFSIISSYFKH